MKNSFLKLDNISFHGQTIFIDLLLIILSVYLLHGSLENEKKLNQTFLKISEIRESHKAVKTTQDRLLVKENGEIFLNNEVLTLPQLQLTLKKNIPVPISLEVEVKSQWINIGAVFIILGQTKRKIVINYET